MYHLVYELNDRAKFTNVCNMVMTPLTSLYTEQVPAVHDPESAESCGSRPSGSAL